MNGREQNPQFTLDLQLLLEAEAESHVEADVPKPSLEQTQRAMRRLLELLLNLDAARFEECVAQLLEALSFQDISIADSSRMPRHFKKERNRQGGYDLSARASTLSEPLVLIQAKQYRSAVSRRYVDELIGSMLRQSAPQGILIATSKFSASARQAAAHNRLLPVTLIDGDSLAELLFRYRMGVVLQEGNGRPYWRLDSRFFRDLTPRAS